MVCVWGREIGAVGTLLTPVILLSRHRGSCGSLYTLRHVKIKVFVYCLEIYVSIYASLALAQSLH